MTLPSIELLRERWQLCLWLMDVADEEDVNWRELFLCAKEQGL